MSENRKIEVCLNFNFDKDFYSFSGRDLKELRKQLDKSQDGMAKLMGFSSRSYCHNLEKRQSLPKHLSLLCSLIKKSANV